MTINYDSFSEEERDNFVKNVLTEEEIGTAIQVYTAGGHKWRETDALLEFCFKVAIKKMDKFKEEVARKREA